MNNRNNWKILSLSLLIGGALWAAEAPTSPNAETGIADMLDDLRQTKDLELRLSELVSWDSEALRHRKLQPLLLGLLNNDKLTKMERLLLLDTLNDLAIVKGVIDHDELGSQLVAFFENKSSPNFQLMSMETLLELDGIKNASLQRQLDKLVEEVMRDAVADLKDQKYSASLHAEALMAFDATKTSSKQIDLLEDLLKAQNRLSPTLQKGIHRAITNLAIAKPDAFSKNDKRSFLKLLLDRLGNHPGRMSTGVTENEVETLITLLGAIEPLLADEDNAINLDKGVDDVEKILQHDNLDIVKAAGDVLLAVAEANHPRNKMKLDIVLMAELDKAEKSKASEARRLHLLRLLIHFEGLLLKGDYNKADDRLEPILKLLHETVLTHPSIPMRTLALDGFFVLEPSYFEGKLLSKDSRKTLYDFVKDCAEVMNNKAAIETLPDLIERMGTVLFEITGRDFGTDGKLWSEWQRKEGQDFF